MRVVLKAVVLGVVVAGLALFILQNREVIELDFLGWEFRTRRAYVILTVFGAGFMSGWITTTVAQLGARSRETRSAPASRRRTPKEH